MIAESDIATIEAHFRNTPGVEAELGRFWIAERGGRWSGLRQLGDWLWLHRATILRILGIAIMFLDEEPKTDHKAEGEGNPPRPRTRKGKPRKPRKPPTAPTAPTAPAAPAAPTDEV